ncbi:helix-turn-helix transcriptional regulator [Streptomyces sp. NPDC001714]|uniref:PadR family transcriptional regulator n=1 Tax=Streptomyces sp. NPDC001714 TaxID=3364603 RepID=UPI0036AA12AC
MTRLPNGTLFPLLERLRQAGWVERYWEQDQAAETEGRPRRRYYRITPKGAERAPHALAAATAAGLASGRPIAPAPASDRPTAPAPASDRPTAARPGLAGGAG